MAGRNYSTDHSWFSSRPCCNCFARLQTCEFLLESVVYEHAFCFWIIEFLFIAFVFVRCASFFSTMRRFQNGRVCLFCRSFFHNRAHGRYIYLIDRVRGPYWQNIGPRSWQYGSSRFGEVRTKKTEGRYSPSTARANSVNKRFITRLLVSEKTRTANATSIQRAKIAKIKLIVFVGFLVQL